MKLIFSIQRELWSNAIAIHMAQETKSGLAIARQVIFEPLTKGELTEPVLRIRQEDAQALADGLYAAGIHPAAAAGSAGQLTAVQYHLEDMRALTFKGDRK